MSAPAQSPDHNTGDRVSLHRLVTALEAAGVWHQARGDRIYFRCPLPDHEDRDASASADWHAPSGDRPGQVRFQCHRCGRDRNGEVVAALGLAWTDLYDDAPARPAASSPRAGQPRSAPVAPSAPAEAPQVDKSAAPRRVPTRRTTRVFTDAEGVDRFRLHRYDPIPGAPGAAEADKGFSWEHRGGPRGGWRAGKRCKPGKECSACVEGRTPALVPLYRLPDVLATAEAGRRVWITEGGKNADQLQTMLPAGEVATTAPDGARAPWAAEYTAAITSGAAPVTVVADRDRPGYEHAATVAAELGTAGTPVQVVRTPLEQEGADASDHLDAGLGPTDFEPIDPVAAVPETSVAAAAPAREAPDTASEQGAEVRDLDTERSRRDGRRRGGQQTSPPARMRTDLGNAERLVDRHGADLLRLAGQWYVWDGTRFRLDRTGAIERRAKQTVRSIYGEAQAVAGHTEAAEAERKATAKHAVKSEARGSIKAMVELAASDAAVVVEDADELDADPWLLNCVNGTVDLRTGRLREHAQADRITKTTGVTFELDAAAPTWDGFLTRILPDPGSREFLQRIIGYSLTGLTSEEKLFLLNGGGANGKSTCIGMIMAALGEYAMAAPPDLLISKRRDIPNDLAALRGARVASSSETEEGARLDETRTKELVTGDKQSARQLYGDFFDFQPKAKYWIATNHRPIIRGSDDAIWRRMVLFPFPERISDSEKDPQLGSKLRAELPGILAWAVRGCLAWQRDGLEPPEAIRAATNAYRAEQDLIGGFLDERCVLHPRAETPASALYGDYKQWCEAAGEHPQSQRRFGQRLGERGYTKAKAGHANTVTWYGVGLRLGGHWDHLDTAPDPSSAGKEQQPPTQPQLAEPTPPATTTSAPTLTAVAPEPCDACRVPGDSCGFGGAGDEQAQCVVCGEPTRVRSRCGVPRHGRCENGGTDTSPPCPDGPRTGAETGTVRREQTGKDDSTSGQEYGGQRQPSTRAARVQTEPRRGLHLYGVLDDQTLTVVKDRRPGVTEPLEDAYPRTLERGCVELARHHGLEALWVHDSALPRFGLDAESEEPPEGSKVGAWQVADRGEPEAVELAIPAWLASTGTWAEARTGRELAAALATYEDAIGMRFRAAPAATALALLGMLHKRHGARRLITPTALPPREVCASERDLSWCRELTDTEAGAGYVIGLDKHGAYPGVMKSLSLGMGDPTHYPNGYWDAKLPGRHRVVNVTPAVERDPLLPDPLTGVARDGQWRCTETLRYAAEQGVQFEVAESYVWPDQSQPLATFSERVRHGRTTLLDRAASDPSADLALTAVKETYAALGGALASRTTEERETPGALWRPDWTGSIIAKARVNMLRNLDKLTTRPFAANVDEVFFAVDDPDPARLGLRLGNGFGQYDVKHAAVPLDKVRDGIEQAARRGRPAPLLTALDAAEVHQ